MKKLLIGISVFLILLVFCIPLFASTPQVILGVEAYEYYYDNPPEEEDSCPYLYTFNGSEYVMENDIYSVARNQVNEYTDYLFINNPLTETAGKIKLKIQEIPFETSMSDYLGLYVINHPAGAKAGVDENGQAHTYSNPVAPSTATYNGTSASNEISSDDRQGINLYDQEALTLQFPSMDLSQGAKLVLKVDGFEHNPDLAATLAIKVPAIKIQTEENGQWVTRSKFYPKMYAAYGVYDLKPYLDQNNIKIRLVSDSCRLDVAHLIDYVALDNTADDCTQTALTLTKALKNDTEDVLGLINSADNSYLELTAETDFVSLEYDSINNPGVNDYFFVSKGYYVPTRNTFYVATKDGSGQWVERYSSGADWYSGADVTKEIDLTGFQTASYFPGADGTYQVRVSNSVGIYDNRWAYIDNAYLKVNGQLYAMTGAVDAATGQDILAQLQISDNVRWDALNRGVVMTFGIPVPATEVRLNKTATTISQGSQETLTATVLPENASFKRLAWTSSNNLVATVDQNGVVKAVSVGTARITAISMDGPYAGCDVTVNDTTPPAITLLTPAPNTSSTENMPLISAKITDANGIDSTRVTLTLDGTPAGSFNPATGVVSYQPNNVISAGQHTVTVSAFDIYNNQAATSWSFTIIDTPPVISNVIPPNMMGTRTVRPTISADIADSTGIDVSRLSITVDGTPLIVNFNPDQPGSILSGTVYGVPANDLSNTMHTAVVKVFDIIGNNAQKTWQFGVNTFNDMPAEFGNCTGCHNDMSELENRHIANSGDCNLCHGRVIFSVDDCAECHSHYWDIPLPIGNYSCTLCHNSTYWDVIPTHGSPNEADLHNYTQLGQDCQNCHLSKLTMEHNIYIEGRGYGYDCNTCHQSTNSTVKAAISAKNPACSACHGTAGSGHDQLHQGTLAAECIACHQSNISTEHLSRSLTCGTCHNSIDPLIQQAITAKNLNCNACHVGAVDHETVHVSGIDTACGSCHAATLTADHITNRPALGYNCQTCHNDNILPAASTGATTDMQCARCHSEAHNLLTAIRPPDNIPLYAGLNWSLPISAKIFATEPWVPAEYLPAGKLIVSNRSTAITGKAIRDFYNSELVARGWTLAPALPDDGSNYYDMTFTQNEAKVRISFYGGEDHTGSPVVSSGYRVEILYK